MRFASCTAGTDTANDDEMNTVMVSPTLANVPMALLERMLVMLMRGWIVTGTQHDCVKFVLSVTVYVTFVLRLAKHPTYGNFCVLLLWVNTALPECETATSDSPELSHTVGYLSATFPD